MLDGKGHEVLLGTSKTELKTKLQGKLDYGRILRPIYVLLGCPWDVLKACPVDVHGRDKNGSP